MQAGPRSQAGARRSGMRRTARLRSARWPKGGETPDWPASATRTRPGRHAWGDAGTLGTPESSAERALQPVGERLAREFFGHVELKAHPGVLNEVDRMAQRRRRRTDIGRQLLHPVRMPHEVIRAD